MERVSFKVAKAIKDAGYPQEKLTDKVYLLNCDKEGKLAHYHSALYYDCAVAPTYLEVWLWLWRKKKITIDIIATRTADVYNFVYIPLKGVSVELPQIKKDPERSIIKAIEYLCNNDLLK